MNINLFLLSSLFALNSPMVGFANIASVDIVHDMPTELNQALDSEEVSITVKALENGSGLLEALGEENMQNVVRLTLNGTINGYDIMILRNKMPNLQYLDLTNVDIVANPYQYYQGAHTEDNRLGTNFFLGLVNLLSVKLPKSITYIDKYAFRGCSNLQEVVINEGVVGIDEYAFLSCSQLQKVHIPSSVKTIGHGAFSLCKWLGSVTFEEGILEIGNSAFSGDGILQSISLPSTVERIGSMAFEGCSSLKEFVIPTNLKRIESGTFQNCRSLKEVHIPPMIEYIGGGAFYGDDDIRDVYVYLANPKDIVISQNTFSCWKTATLHVPTFGFSEYYLHTQWGQFSHIDRFDEPYDVFYTNSTIVIDKNTGTISGKPDALFYAHGSLIVNDEEKQALGDVTLTHDGKNSSSLIPQNTGNIILETLGVDIKVNANKWHFFCFPFDVDLSSIVYDGEYVWRRYDGEKRSRREGGWQDLPAGTNKLQARTGYIFWGTKEGVLHLQVDHPTIDGNDFSANLSTHNTADTHPSDAGWNFLGNPYTSYYTVDETTYNAPITVWTGNGYEAYRPCDDDYEFAPYQAFFVQVSDNSNTVDFFASNREGFEDAQITRSQRRVLRAQKRINPSRLLVDIVLRQVQESDNNYLDKTRIVFNDDCSLEYESDCDAAKFFSEDRCGEIYTIDSEGTQYAINERPKDDGYANIGFIAHKKGVYHISAQRMDIPVLLVDNVMDVVHDLSLGDYEFTSVKGIFNKRFTLRCFDNYPTSISELSTQIGMNYQIDNGVLFIEGLDPKTRVCLYDMMGRQVSTLLGNGSLPVKQHGTYIIAIDNLSAKIVL